MAERVPNLCLDHEVVSIDLPSQTVTARHNGSVRSFRFRKGCAATLPLPSVIAMCSDAPPGLKAACAALPRMRVICVMIGIKGPRPSNRGHWRYYADETISFNRLVYLHEFDPSSAPSDGWGMLAEITQRAELPFTDERELWRLVERDLRRVGAIPPECRVSLARQHVIDPAYVVFEKGTETTIEAARAHLSRGGATPLGRYGRWEYSSIERNLRDGFHWAAMHADDPVDGGLVRHLG
jgi:protoporphyrinogen oxidase